MTLRALAPSGVPFSIRDLFHGLLAAMQGDGAGEAFRRELSETFGQEHVFLYSSGRGAISYGLKALHELSPDKTEVLIPAFTSFSVPSAVVNAGFTVSLYDLDPQTMSPDIESLKRAVSDRTLCIMVCHLYGCPADIDAVTEIAREKGIPVFDDAAQAMGATVNGRQVGTLGDLGLYSLSRGKNISAVDGGVLVTGDKRLAAVLEAEKPDALSMKGRIKLGVMALALCFLMHPRLYWIPRSLPFLNLGASVFDPDFEVTAFTSFQAGLGMRMLRRLDRITNGRKRVAAKWMRNFEEQSLPRLIPGGESVWLRLPVMNGGSESIPEFGVVPVYPTSLDAIPELKPHLARQGTYPGAVHLAEATVTLPTHQYVSDEDVEAVSRAMRERERA